MANNTTLADELFSEVQTEAKTAVREPSHGGPRFVTWDGQPATAEMIEAYYAGEYSIIDMAPNVPRQSWER